jgi:hypothetical protein
VASAQCAGRTLVVPSAPSRSYLVNKLDGIDMCTGSKMPKSGTLGAADRQLIVDWIAQGANNN